MIINEKTNKVVNENSGVMSVCMPAVSEKFNPKEHWEVIDEITHKNGVKENRRYFNTVVNDCSRVLASLMLGKEGYKGISYWAVGSGEKSWSNEKPPTPSVEDNKLVNETFRKAIPKESICFIDDGNNPTEKVTNRLQITLTFGEGEANGELREFGLFGGDATMSTNSGIMINHKNHPLIYKTSGMEIKRIIRITF